MNQTAIVQQTGTAPAALSGATLEKVVIGGDLSALTPGERVSYYLNVCRSTGLNPATRPFEYLRLNGKLVLYARKDATDQLRSLRSVSITKLECERIEDVYVVRAYAKDREGREDVSTGAVTVGSLKGELLANATMKAETKAKRRVTLSICGLGLLDESEVGSIADARPVVVDRETGEILGDAIVERIEETKKTRTKRQTPAEVGANAAVSSAPSGDPERDALIAWLWQIASKRHNVQRDAFAEWVAAQCAGAKLIREQLSTSEGRAALRKYVEERFAEPATVAAAAVPAEPEKAVDPADLPF